MSNMNVSSDQKLIRLLDDCDPVAWDAVADHPLQSYAWGVARARMGKTVLRFGEHENDTLRAVYQMTLHPIPHTGYSVGYIPRSIVPSENFLLFLKKFCVEKKIIFVQFEPSAFVDKEKIKTTLLRPSANPLLPKWTQDISLLDTKENLLSRCDKDTRYAIRLAEREGVVVRELIGQDGYALFEKMYFDTTKRQGFLGHSRAHQQLVWETMSAAGQAKLFGSFFGDELLAVFEVFYFKNAAYYLYGGSSTENRRLSGPTIGLWQILTDAKKADYESFDFWGSLAPGYDSSHPWAGFTKFKQGFGTTFREYLGSYDLVVSPVLYELYGLLFQLRALCLTVLKWARKKAL